jgi:hypothetical protein
MGLNWIAENWSHLQLHDAKIKVKALWTPQQGRENSVAIMESITSSGLFTARELQEINRWCLYLRMFFILDITDIHGTSMDTCIQKGKRQSNQHSKWEWPVHQRPTARKAWKIAIYEVLFNNDILLAPLRAWIRGHHTKRDWYLDIRSQYI